jgi:NADH:ubiquinone oxidoreductase subunit D
MRRRCLIRTVGLSGFDEQRAGVLLGVEKLGQIEVPARASALRVIMAELNRIASHLVAFGTYALDLGAFTPFLYAFREREMILAIFEKISGGRLLYHYPRIGGVARDMTPGLDREIREFLVQMRKVWPEYNALLSENLIFVKRTANVGAIPREQAIAWGLTGPCLRGSGGNSICARRTLFGIRKYVSRFRWGGSQGNRWRLLDRIGAHGRDEEFADHEQALDGLPEDVSRKLARF